MKYIMNYSMVKTSKQFFLSEHFKSSTMLKIRKSYFGFQEHQKHVTNPGQDSRIVYGAVFIRYRIVFGINIQQEQSYGENGVRRYRKCFENPALATIIWTSVLF